MVSGGTFSLFGSRNWGEAVIYKFSYVADILFGFSRYRRVEEEETGIYLRNNKLL